MFFQRGSRRILAYSEPVDMRKGFHGLTGLARNVLNEDALSGDLYVFINRARTILRGLWWDRTGWCVLSKRLERARFELRTSETKQELSERELELLLDGVLTKIGAKHVHR